MAVIPQQNAQSIDSDKNRATMSADYSIASQERAWLMAMRQALLMQIDALECYLQIARTSDLRKQYRRDCQDVE